MRAFIEEGKNILLIVIGTLITCIAIDLGIDLVMDINILLKIII